MARRHKHEEHANHEAWAIPYGDLITLLLAFFVVMYAMSSVNEGKYRVLSDSLVAAFQRRAARRSSRSRSARSSAGLAPIRDQSSLRQAADRDSPPQHVDPADRDGASRLPTIDAAQSDELAERRRRGRAVDVGSHRPRARRRCAGMASGSKSRSAPTFFSRAASRRCRRRPSRCCSSSADTLKPFPNSIRVEGHTDNRPINTPAFPSNWELSAARAASVVHLFTRAGMDPARLAVIGLGENRPSQSNATAEGRNANRRVLLVILGGNERPEGDYAEERGQEEPPVAEPPTVPVALPQPASVEASLPPAAATQRTLP